jgi:hypothetical protein
MAQAGYTPIQLYLSTTASAVPSAGNLANGELAINITDGKLFYKDNGGVVQVLATKGAGTIGGSNTQVQYNNAGSLAGSANLTFDGTKLSVGGTAIEKLTTDGNIASTAAQAYIYSNGGSGTSVNAGFLLSGSDNTVRFYAANVEQARLTSGGLVVGSTTVPTVGSTAMLAVGNANGGTQAIVQSGSIVYRTSASTSGVDFYNPNASPMQWYTNGTLRLTLQANGNLHSTSNYTTVATGGYWASGADSYQVGWYEQSGAMLFRTGGSERGRFASAGAFCIGTTTATQNRLNVVGGANMTYWEGGNSSTNITSGTPDQFICKINDATVGNFWQFRFQNNSGNTMFSMGAQTTSSTANFNNGKFFIDGGIRATPQTFIVDTTNEYTYLGYSSSNGSYRLQVNGQIFATSSTIATSDGRYKENVQDLTGALDLVNLLRPVSFNWKKHNIHNFNTEDTTVGFIAQEVKQAMAGKPYLNSFIKVNKCTSFDEVEKKACDEEFMGLAETNMIAILTKAIQEQQTIINQLKARLDAANL